MRYTLERVKPAPHAAAEESASARTSPPTPRHLSRGIAKRLSCCLFSGRLAGALLWSVTLGVHLVSGETTLRDPWVIAAELALLVLFTGLGAYVQFRLRTQSHTEDELRKFSRAVVQSPSTVMITNRAGDIEYVNPKFTDLTGYTLDEVRGQNPRILKSGHTPPDEYARMWQTISAGGEWRGELQNVKKNGELYWEAALIAPIKGAEGAITHYIALKEDVTARKQAEESEREQRAFADALREISAALTRTLDLEAVLDVILSNLDDPVVPHTVATLTLVEDGDAYEVRACPHFDAAEHAPLVTRRRIEDEPLLAPIVAQRAPRTIADVRREAAPDAGEPSWQGAYLGVPILGDGSVLGVLSFYSATPGFYTPRYVERAQAFADQAAIALTNARLYQALSQHAGDLQQRVTARTRDLEHERAQLGAILDAMGEGVIYIERQEVVYTNQAFVAMLGYGQGDLLAIDPTQLYERLFAAGEGYLPLREEIRGTLAAHDKWSRELRLQRADGSTFDAAMTTAYVRDGDGETIGYVSVVRNITREKGLQEQRDRFMRHAAHELRTPVSNFKTRLYLLRRQPEKLLQHLSVMERVTDEMTELIEDLLDVFRFQREAVTLRLVSLDLRALLRTVMVQSQQDAALQQVELRAEIDGPPLLICADEQRLHQAFSRMITNAIYQAAGAGDLAEVHLRTRHTEAGEAAVLTLRDRGNGYTPDQLPQIFDPFYHVTEGSGIDGVGLGLTLARQIIELHDGTITVESQTGGGTTFEVTLALCDGCPESCIESPLYGAEY